ncbi:MAG: maleylpyruvate isomerase N-terminal domain-containing protein [Thermomicrobia bacterium]|nr:maleylpyruvate isomerase N-terminal domain-containing protein [Thermomicrobia bacterium]MCA1723011.1 maleylpyruvate isomerase N-terminal domain-containing protein [Thermomicrobia bacterium]
MSERAEQLATELEQANAEVIAFAETCPADVWTVPCVDDGRTVAAVVRHVGGAYIAHMRLVQAVAAGESIPAMFGDWSMIHQGNAVSAEKYARADREETLASLQRNGGNLAEAIRALSDEELARTAVVPIFGDTARTTEQILESAVIAHPHGHLVGLRATVANSR